MTAVLLTGYRPVAAYPRFADVMLAELEVERLEDIADAAAASLSHAVPIWRAARGSQRIITRRQAASAIQAVKCAQGALAQARRALAHARRSAQGAVA